MYTFQDELQHKQSFKKQLLKKISHLLAVFGEHFNTLY